MSMQWGAESSKIRAALAAEARTRDTTDDELFEQGYISADYENRQNVLRARARDERMLRQAPEPVSAGVTAE